jgi:hypothetical protein
MLPQRHTSKIAAELDGKPAFLLRIPEFSGALAADDPAAFKASTQYR